MTRARWVLAHRYAGLLMAFFLVVAGATGALLAWNDELEAALSPGLFLVATPSPQAQPLDPLRLREQVARRYPQARVDRVDLDSHPGRSLRFSLDTRDESVSLPNNEVFVDPYTGAVLGERRWGDLSQGRKNLMPFIYRLHFSLAVDGPGTVLFGLAAVMWTVDCVVGLVLTFPASFTPWRRAWWQRWRTSWLVRWSAGGHRLTLDLHRASGLWLWVLLFALAWSAVAFNLPGVYQPVMHALLPHQADGTGAPARAPAPGEPMLSWSEAREHGRRLIAAEARRGRFTVQREAMLSYDPTRGSYRYAVRSSADIRAHGGRTTVVFDSRTGQLQSTWLPTGGRAGDTATTWITGLHMAALGGPVGGWPLKTGTSVLGIAVVALSTTGLLVWRRKARARARARAGAALSTSRDRTMPSS
jgi:uncharacterized iron-regulated membrane protein